MRCGSPQGDDRAGRIEGGTASFKGVSVTTSPLRGGFYRGSLGGERSRGSSGTSWRLKDDVTPAPTPSGRVH